MTIKTPLAAVLATAVLLLAAAPTLVADIGAHAGRVTQALGQPGQDKSAVIAAAGHIDIELADLLLALAEKYRTKFDMPKSADPKPLVQALQRDCSGCKPAQIAQAGYQKLDTQLGKLRSYLDGKAAVATVQQTAREALLLNWALKGYSLLALSGASEDEIRRAADSGRGEIGGGLTTDDWNGGMALMGFSGQWAADVPRIADKIRQSNDSGIRHPNADLGAWLLCINCEGTDPY